MIHYSRTQPKARKPHLCVLCGRTIRPGEVYERGAGMDGATAWTWRECAHCDAIIELARRQAGFDDEYSDVDIHEWEPETLPELRVKAWWRRKWTRDDGSLYPVPEKVYATDRHGFGWQTGIEVPS